MSDLIKNGKQISKVSTEEATSGQSAYPNVELKFDAPVVPPQTSSKAESEVGDEDLDRILAELEAKAAREEKLAKIEALRARVTLAEATRKVAQEDTLSAKKQAEADLKAARIKSLEAEKNHKATEARLESFQTHFDDLLQQQINVERNMLVELGKSSIDEVKANWLNRIQQVKNATPALLPAVERTLPEAIETPATFF